MKLYLSAPYVRRLEMVERAAEVEGLGHYVVSRWVRHGRDEIQATLVHAPDMAPLRTRIVEENMRDLVACDALIHFSHPEPDPRGTRHVETGFALALFRPIFVVGTRENIFQIAPHVRTFPKWGELIRELARAMARAADGLAGAQWVLERQEVQGGEDDAGVEAE